MTHFTSLPHLAQPQTRFFVDLRVRRRDWYKNISPYCPFKPSQMPCYRANMLINEWCTILYL